MTELELQKRIVDAANDDGGFGKKVSHTMVVGIADLFIQLQGLIGIWMEVKIRKGIPAKGIATIALTPHQRRFIINIQRAGGKAGWLLGMEASPGEFLLLCGTNADAEQVPIADAILRKRGGPWPIREIVQRIIGPTWS